MGMDRMIFVTEMFLARISASPFFIDLQSMSSQRKFDKEQWQRNRKQRVRKDHERMEAQRRRAVWQRNEQNKNRRIIIKPQKFYTEEEMLQAGKITRIINNHFVTDGLFYAEILIDGQYERHYFNNHLIQKYHPIPMLNYFEMYLGLEDPPSYRYFGQNQFEDE